MARRAQITDARRVAEATGARQCIVLTFYGPEAGDLAGKMSGSSYCATRAECARVGRVLDVIFDAILLGKIRGPR
jgi:hypothetical protein